MTKNTITTNAQLYQKLADEHRAFSTDRYLPPDYKLDLPSRKLYHEGIAKGLELAILIRKHEPSEDGPLEDLIYPLINQ